MAKGEVLGHIDCPACGLAGGMRITEDKSGNPFGYCEGDCDQQMRIGGNAARVEKFYKKYPHIRRAGESAAPVTVPDTGAAAAVAEVEKPQAATQDAGRVEGNKKPKQAPHWTEYLGVQQP